MKSSFVVVFVVLIACSERVESPKPAAVAPPKALCLAPPGGASAVDEKITKLIEQVKLTPAREDRWVELGRAWVPKARQSADPGFYAHADGCAQVALELKQGYAPALALRGLVLLNDHRFKEARALAKNILATDPDDLMALGVLSDAELELGELDRAAEAAQKMVDLKPSLPSYSRAAYLRWLQGDVKAAKEIIRLAMDSGIDQRDSEPGAWVIVEAAKMFWHEGDYAGAEAGFDRALERVPEYPPALLGKARTRMALGDFDTAAKLARRAFELSNLAEAAWVWGDAERAAGRNDVAERAFEHVVKIGRQSDHRTLAAFFAAENRDLVEAEKLITAELQLRGDIYTHDAHAWVLHRLGKHGEARAAIDRAVRHGTKDATLLYHAGAIHLASGDKTAGRRLLKEALSLSAKFHPAAAVEAQQLLQSN
jgi:tetratricopeptide (TPR) repeat protein